jgi:hypothetical protein
MDIMASMMLKYSLLKSIDIPLFTVCVILCIQSSNVEGLISVRIMSVYGVFMCPV